MQNDQQQPIRIGEEDAQLEDKFGVRTAAVDAVGDGSDTPPATVGEGIQQIPAQIVVTQPPAVTDARDKLLSAIGAEAQRVAETSAGQASAALVELARAYALVAPHSTAITVPAADTRARAGAISLGAHVPTGGFYVASGDADLINKGDMG